MSNTFESRTQGPQGFSAYQIAVANGFVGTEPEWIASLKGNTGDAATIQVGATQTLAPGSAATVTNSGTSGAAILNFGIPQGQVGPMGEVSTAQLNAAIAAALLPLRPVVTTQPNAVSGNVGDSLAISCLGAIIPNTHLNLTYQWQLSTDAGVSYSNITGATSPSIPFAPALVGNNGLYRCRLTNAFGSQDTNAVALTVDGSIRHLYGVNDRGIAWDLDRMDHLWQGNSGIPVTAYGDPVGLLVTRERGGLDNLGPELITNGSFVDATGWTLSGVTIAGGTANWDNVTNGSLSLSSAPLVIGRFYCITYTVTEDFVNALSFRDGTTNYMLQSQVGTHRTVIRSTSINVTFRNFGIATTGKLDNVSIREIPGVHLIQPTSSRRPTYARRPRSGIRNLARFTEQFENVYWTKTGSTIVVDADTDPNGGVTADLVRENTANSNHLVVFTTPILAGVHTFSFFIKPQGRNRINVISNNQSIIPLNINLDLVPGFTAPGLTVTDAGNGWLRIVTVTGVCSGSNGISIRLRDTAGSTTYVGDGSSGVLLWGAQLEAGAIATAYQRVTNQFDVTESGQQSINYLWCDGIDDCMQSATAIDFSNSDEMTVCLGQRKLSDSGQRTLIGLGAGVDSADGTIQLAAPNGASPTYAFRSRGTTVQTAEATGFPQPDLCILTGQADISADSITLRRNAVQVANSTADQGTGNYANAILHLGSRAGSSLFFSGHINSGFIINRILNPLVLADFERHWVAAKAGIDL